MDRLTWLKRYRTEHCLVCKPRNMPFSLVRTTQWCPNCEMIWIYRFLNQDQSFKRATRYMWYEDTKECYRLMNDGKLIKLERKNGRKDRGNGIQA